MRILWLAALFVVLGLGLTMFAEHKAQDVAHPHRLAHSSGAMLAVNFAHADHTHETCISCHHNFVDDTGSGICLDCHKSNSAIEPLIETQFHELCRECHVRAQQQGDAYGPTRVCSECHRADTQP